MREPGFHVSMSSNFGPWFPRVGFGLVVHHFLNYNLIFTNIL